MRDIDCDLPPYDLSPVNRSMRKESFPAILTRGEDLT